MLELIIGGLLLRAAINSENKEKERRRIEEEEEEWRRIQNRRTESTRMPGPWAGGNQTR